MGGWLVGWLLVTRGAGTGYKRYFTVVYFYILCSMGNLVL